MAFTSDLLVQRTVVGQRVSVKEQGKRLVNYSYIIHTKFASDYRCHCHVRSDSLSCVIIADMDYPVRVVFTLMNKVGKNYVCMCTLQTAKKFLIGVFCRLLT